MPIPDHDQLRNMEAVLKGVLPALLSFVAMKFQGSSNSPFETHPITVFLSIFFLLLYCSLFLLLPARPQDFTTACRANVFHLPMILSFFLSIALPTSLLFPGPPFWLLHLPLLIMLSAAPLCCLVQKLIRLVQQKILAFFFIRLFRRRLLGGRAPPILPLTVADTHSALEVWYQLEFNRSLLVAQEETEVTVNDAIVKILDAKLMQNLEI